MSFVHHTILPELQSLHCVKISRTWLFLRLWKHHIFLTITPHSNSLIDQASEPHSMWISWPCQCAVCTELQSRNALFGNQAICVKNQVYLINWLPSVHRDSSHWYLCISCWKTTKKTPGNKLHQNLFNVTLTVVSREYRNRKWCPKGWIHLMLIGLFNRLPDSWFDSLSRRQFIGS